MKLKRLRPGLLDDSTIAINRAGVKQMAKEIDGTPGIKVL